MDKNSLVGEQGGRPGGMQKALGRVWVGSGPTRSRQKSRAGTKSEKLRERQELGKLDSGLACRSPEWRRISSRIPPGRLVWLVGGWVVFFVLVVFSVFYVFVGLVAVLGCLLVVGLLGCWVVGLLGCWVVGLLGCCHPSKQRSNPTTQNPSNPTTQKPKNPTT